MHPTWFPRNALAKFCAPVFQILFHEGFIEGEDDGGSLMVQNSNNQIRTEVLILESNRISDFYNIQVYEFFETSTADVRIYGNQVSL